MVQTSMAACTGSGYLLELKPTELGAKSAVGKRRSWGREHVRLNLAVDGTFAKIGRLGGYSLHMIRGTIENLPL